MTCEPDIILSPSKKIAVNHIKKEKDENIDEKIGGAKKNDFNDESPYMFPKKLRESANINVELNQISSTYTRLKEAHLFMGVFLRVLEALVTFACALLSIVAQSTLLEEYKWIINNKLMFLDDLACHQLDFIEARLEKEAYGSVYTGTTSLAQRFEMAVKLLFRIAFIFPRLIGRMVRACVECVSDELIQDMGLFSELINPPKKSRRVSVRQKSKKSPSRKRKIFELDEDITPGLPDYFVVTTYIEEEDEDYLPDIAEEEGSEDDIETTIEIDDNSDNDDGEQNCKYGADDKPTDDNAEQVDVSDVSDISEDNVDTDESENYDDCDDDDYDDDDDDCEDDGNAVERVTQKVKRVLEKAAFQAAVVDLTNKSVDELPGDDDTDTAMSTSTKMM